LVSKSTKVRTKIFPILSLSLSKKKYGVEREKFSYLHIYIKTVKLASGPTSETLSPLKCHFKKEERGGVREGEQEIKRKRESWEG